MKLFIIVGVPGSGKSTLAKTLAPDSYIFESDKYPGLYSNGELQKKILPLSHQWCQDQVKLHMEKKMSPLIQSNTNLEIQHMYPYLVLAHNYNYSVNIIVPSFGLLHYPFHKDIQFKTICHSRSFGDKCIPEFVMKRMVQTFDKNIESIRNLSLLSTIDMIRFIENNFS
jgi:predicted kinase